jgi:tRNA pseudouridine13 synthase
MIEERDLGLERFLSEGTPGIGGKLRESPEDFVVDEVSVLPPEAASGRYVIAKVWHRNWEANRLVRRLAGNLRVGRGRIGFAGTKDGRSVATQLMSFNAPFEAVTALEIPDVRILDAYRANRMISIGDLVGNRFTIRVADPDSGEGVRSVCEEVRSALDGVGGFPNYFGVQRFGSIRPVTHMIGHDLVRGDPEGAVMRYIANPMGDGSEGDDVRRTLEDTRDFERAMREFPQKYTFERTMISHLVERPDDFIGALRRLPRNLLMMFVHAYQSYMFNRMLSERMRRGVPIERPVVGDFVLPLDKTGNPDQDRPIEVTDDNLEKVTKHALDRKAFVSGLLYGTDSAYSGGVMGEIERWAVESEELSRPDFQIVGLREASSKGSRRALLAPTKDLRIEFGEDGAVVFGFELNKGCYATCLLREFMKAGMDRY